MPLVDYASSGDESDNEPEVDNKEEIESEKHQQNFSAENTKVSDNPNGDNNEELFSKLPKPRKSFSFLEDDNKLSKLLLKKDSLPLGKKEIVKITVPSVSEFEDDREQPAPKKIKPSAKGTGLFSVLPPPKNTVNQIKKNLVPHAVSKNQNKVTVTETSRKVIKNTKAKQTGADEEDDDDTPVGNSFFGSSLEQQNSETEDINSENTEVNEAQNDFVIPNSSFNEPLTVDQIPEQNLVSNTNEVNFSYSTDPSQTKDVVSASDNPLDLDEKALQILCGNKKKRHQMPMNIIDLSSEEVLPDSKEWLLKQFTEEKRGRGHSHKKHQGPSSMSKRKHQITYLAYQAKEQELELQNQWANNRMSRKQTQSKYGF